MPWVFLFLFVVGFCWAEDGLSVGGWVRGGAGTAVIVASHGQFSNWTYGGETVWRLSVLNRDIEYGRFEASGDIAMLSGVMTNMATSSLRWQIGEETLLVADVRKFSVMVKPFWGDVIIGRQLVRWGEGVIFSPMDFFAKLDVMDVSLSRLGVDALRVKIPVGQLGFVESIGMMHSSWTNSTAGIRLGSEIASWYATGACFYRRKEKEWIGGISLKGDLGLTWYGELVYHHATNDKASFWQGMIGTDYSFGKKWVFRAEYMMHTLERTNFSLLEQYGLAVYPFLSHYYASFQLMVMPSIIDTLSLTVVANLDDKEENLWEKGQWWIVSYTRNLYQNVNLFLWFRYFTDISALTSERQGLFSGMVSVEVRY